MIFLAGKLLHKLKGHKFNVNSMKISHSRNLLLSCSHDACILWDLTTFKIYKILHSKNTGFSAATFSPDSDSLITCFQDCTLYFWSLATFEVEEKITLPLHTKINKLATSLESRYLVAAGASPIIFVFDMHQKQNYRSYQIPSGCDEINDVYFLQDARMALLGNDDQVYIVDLDRELRIQLKKGITGKAIISFDIDFNGKYLVGVTNTGEIYLYDLAKLIEDEEKTVSKKLSMGVPAELAYQTLKASPVGQINQQLEKKSETMHIPTTHEVTDRLSERPTSPARSVDTLRQTGESAFKTGTSRHQTFTDNLSTGKVRERNERSRSTIADNASRSTHHSIFSEKIKTQESTYSASKFDISKTNMNKPQLAKFFAKYGIFPDKHRALIWRFLLDLPLNIEAYENLVALGTHSAYANLQKNYPIKSTKLFNKLQRMLSCLAHYSPIFSEVEYLPGFIFPFVKLFAHDECLCFEIILTFFLHWGQHFFEFFPNPPLTIIQATEELLKYHDPALASHFKSLGLNMIHYIWPFMQSLFTEILTRDDWLSLMDFLVLNHEEPLYMPMFIVAYFRYFRTAIIPCTEIENIEYFIKKQNAVNIQSVIKLMTSMMKKTPSEAIVCTFKTHIPLIGGQYPIYNFYPKYSVENHKKIREEIENEERKLEARKSQIEQIQSLTDELLKQEERYKERQEALIRAEKERKEMLLYEEEIRLQKKLRLEAEARERRLNQLKVLEEAVKKSLHEQERLREEEFRDFNRELEIRNKIDNYIIQSRLEEEALLNLEFQAAQRLNEIIDLRNKEERARKLRIEMEQRDRQARIKERIWEDNIRAEDEEAKLKLDLLRQQKLQEYTAQLEQNDQKELEYRLMLEDFQRELKLRDIERERRLRRIAEEEVIKNEEFMKLYKQHEEALKEEDRIQARKLMDEERNNAIRRAEERLAILEQEKRIQAAELEKYREKLKEIGNAQKRQEFEDKILEMRKENELRLLEEEKKLQKMILEIEEERKVQREMQQELAFKEKEFQEKMKFHQTLKQHEEQILEEERERFREFRNALEQELEKVEEVKQRVNEAKLKEMSLQREELIRQHTEEIRKKIQTENMMKYIHDLKQGESELESLHSEKPSASKREDTRNIFDYTSNFLVRDSRTGTFKSANSTAQKLGSSASSYTYSETAPEDNAKSRRTKSSSKLGYSEHADEVNMVK